MLERYHQVQLGQQYILLLHINAIIVCMYYIVSLKKIPLKRGRMKEYIATAKSAVFYGGVFSIKELTFELNSNRRYICSVSAF